MPYVCYPVSETVETAIASFRAKPDAIAFRTSRADSLAIGFVPTDRETQIWQDRETDRFTSYEYARLPWEREYFDGGRLQPYASHFAHVSLKTPGKLAYTPDETWGHEDRQLVIKPGKYLQQFAPFLSDVEREQWTTACLATTIEHYRLAVTAEEITTLHVNGPESCMGGKPVSRYQSSVHPCTVYADSPDLKCAYLGPIDAAVARVLIWPDRKLFTVIYSDSGDDHRLRGQLIAEGYSYSKRFPSGARIQRLESDYGDGYVMPYLDIADYVGTTSDRRYFVVNGGNRTGLDVHTQTGVTTDRRCENCGESCDADASYCDSCDHDRWSCERCGESSFSTDDACCIGDCWYCEDCADRYGWHCAHCGDRGLTRDGEYQEIDGEIYCDPCVDRHFSYCDTCEAYYRPTRTTADCPDCPEPEPEPEPEPNEYDRLMQVNPCVPFARVNGVTEPVAVDSAYGCFIVHRTIGSTHGYTVTHVPTGRSAGPSTTRDHAIAIMRRLQVPGIDWNFTDVDAMPAETRNHGYAVVRSVSA